MNFAEDWSRTADRSTNWATQPLPNVSKFVASPVFPNGDLPNQQLSV